MAEAMPEYDVLVVGAGLTGLVAAWQCQKSGKAVLVLEGRERVGGRTETVSFDAQESLFDLGARFVASYQQDVWDLIHELGLETFDQYQGPSDPGPDSDPVWDGLGANLLQLEGREQHLAYVGPVLPMQMADQFYLKYLKTLVDDFPIHDPARVDNAKLLDQLSVQEWVEQLELPDYGPPSVDFRGLVRLLCRVGFSDEPENISMLWLLFYVASSGGLDRFQAVRWPDEGAQAYRIKTGAASIARKLSEQLVELGGRIELNQRVRHIEQQAGTVRVRTDAAEFRAKKVLVALPPTLYADGIEFAPKGLPEPRRSAARAMQMPPTIVATVTFSKAFWRTKRRLSGSVFGEDTPDIARHGLSGDVLSTHGPVVWMMDGSSSVGQPALFAFIVGDSARELGAASERRRSDVVLGEMRKAFGPELDDYVPQYHEHDWSKQALSLGGPAAHFPKGTFYELGREILLTGAGRPDQNVYFASSETALLSNGYMSGAVWSGRRVADEICEVPAPQKVKLTGRVRERAMLWCMRRILRAIELQEPSVELAALSTQIEFFGPGGTTLPRGPYNGHKGTFVFYRQLARQVKLDHVNIEACSADVESNSGFAAFSVSGRVIRTGNPFRDIKATMVFDFNNDAPDNEKVVVTRDWLFMDTQQVDALVAAPPGVFSEAATSDVFERQVLPLAQQIARLEPHAVRLAAQGKYQSTANALADRFPKREVVASKFDKASLTYYSWQRVGDDKFLLVSVRFANSLEPVVSDVSFSL